MYVLQPIIRIPEHLSLPFMRHNIETHTNLNNGPDNKAEQRH